MIAHRNIVKDVGRIFVWYPLRWLTATMPPGVLYATGGLIGDMDGVLSVRGRIRRMVGNISGALGISPGVSRRLVRENLRNHARNMLEFMKYPQLSCREKIERHLLCERFEVLDRELSRGRGVILITGHFGAKQFLQVGLGGLGYRVNQIHYHAEGGELSAIQKRVSQRMRKKVEEGIPARFISADGFLRAAFECLRDNEILIIAGDGAGVRSLMTKGYVPYRFLGKRMLFPSNVAAMAKKTGASLVPAFVVRRGVRHAIVIEDAIRTEDRSVEEIYGDFVKILERYVRRYPHLWEFWEEFEPGHLLESAESDEGGPDSGAVPAPGGRLPA